jgi:hypothetical protein
LMVSMSVAVAFNCVAPKAGSALADDRVFAVMCGLQRRSALHPANAATGVRSQWLGVTVRRQSAL